jgi:hypothetical protein
MQDTNPEQFNPFDAMHDVDRLDGPRRVVRDKCQASNEAVENCTMIIDKFWPAREVVTEQPVTIGQTEALPSNVVDMQEYRELRNKRHDARDTLNQQPETSVSSEFQPPTPTTDQDAEHLASVHEMINRARAA